MKRILILVMSHETNDEIFINYKNVWDEIIKLNKNKYPIDVLFLYSDENINEEYELIDNKLFSKCEENYWGSLLVKLISGLKYFNTNDYDLVFKTNLSTMVNFELFNQKCQSIDINQMVYEGIIGKYLDYNFCSGAGMLLNKKTVNLVLENTDKITKEWTDDIFIGFILNKLNNIPTTNFFMNRYDVLNGDKLDSGIKNFTHIRVKIRLGDKDISYFNDLFDLLYK